MSNKATVTKMTYNTKDPDELIPYIFKGYKQDLPMVYVYKYSGGEKEALKHFMRLGSFIMAKTNHGYVAFPAKGISFVQESITDLLYRVENGKVSDMKDVCAICGDRVKKLLSGCDECNGLKNIRQINRFHVKAMPKKAA